MLGEWARTEALLVKLVAIHRNSQQKPKRRGKNTRSSRVGAYLRIKFIRPLSGLEKEKTVKEVLLLFIIDNVVTETKISFQDEFQFTADSNYSTYSSVEIFKRRFYRPYIHTR